MHEISLAREILRILQEQARMQGFERIHRVHVELGPLSCIDSEALNFAFEAVTVGTLAQGACLELHRPPARGACRRCGHGYTMESLVTPCPRCDGPGRILSGLEMRVLDLEVSGGDPGTLKEG